MSTEVADRPAIDFSVPYQGHDVPLTVVIPVYNEGANFPRLWHAITRSIVSDFTAIMMYDFDEDDTAPVVQQVIDGGEPRLHLQKNSIHRGVVGAIRTGLVADQGPVLVVMADLSDDLLVVDRVMYLYRRATT